MYLAVRISHNIGIVHFSGRNSGRKLSPPLSYTLKGNAVRLLSNQSTRWCQNFRGEGARRFIHALPRDTSAKKQRTVPVRFDPPKPDTATTATLRTLWMFPLLTSILTLPFLIFGLAMLTQTFLDYR